MTRDPIAISVDASVFDLVQLFHAKEFRHPLVTDGDGRLVFRQSSESWSVAAAPQHA